MSQKQAFRMRLGVGSGHRLPWSGPLDPTGFRARPFSEQGQKLQIHVNEVIISAMAGGPRCEKEFVSDVAQCGALLKLRCCRRRFERAQLLVSIEGEREEMDGF